MPQESSGVQTGIQFLEIVVRAATAALAISPSLRRRGGWRPV
jgi:hypothetical protein